MYQVIIVEDDPMVAEIDKQYVEHNSKMAIAGIFQNGQEALDFVRTHPVNLIMLDYYMPVMDGRTFLVKLRAEGILADVIMVTAASEARHVSELYSYGVSDYLIKPFDYNRFQTALQKFVSRREAFAGDKAFNQEELDKVISPEGQRGGQFVDKGIHPVTLEIICSFLREHKSEKLSIEDIAKNVSLSRVTLRRYMNYLIDKNSVIGGVDYSQGAAPLQCTPTSANKIFPLSELPCATHGSFSVTFDFGRRRLRHGSILHPVYSGDL